MSLAAFDLPSTGTTQRHPAEFDKLSKKFEERSPLSAVCGVIFFENQYQPRHRDIASTSTPCTSSRIFERGNSCHAITREAGKETARAITRVAGKESGFTLSRRAKSFSSPYTGLTVTSATVNSANTTSTTPRNLHQTIRGSPQEASHQDALFCFANCHFLYF